MVATQVEPKPTTSSEHELIERLVSPSTRQKAFDELVGTYKERVYFTVRKMVIDHSDAEDLMQEIFLKIWNNLQGFRSESKLSTWIYKIAVNESLTFLARKKRRHFLGYQSEMLEKLEAQSELQADRVQLLLQKALLKLPPKQRLIFNMRYYDEMNYEQMSEILGTSVGALKASYHFAVKKIEDFLTKND
jgi:RNA polymerase sigma-70 factor (ECF subfamily)